MKLKNKEVIVVEENKELQELTEQIQIRREKLAQLQAEGQNPFEKTKFEVTKHSDEVKAEFETLENQDVSIAGRLMYKRTGSSTTRNRL